MKMIPRLGWSTQVGGNAIHWSRDTEAQGVWVSMGDVSPVCCLRTQRYSARTGYMNSREFLVYKEAEVNRTQKA